MGIGRRALHAVAVTLCCTSAALADDVVGQRVRVELTPTADVPEATARAADGCGRRCRRVEGRLVDVTADGTLLIRLEGRNQTVEVAEPAVSVVEVSLGRRPSGPAARRGAAVGALAGLAVGASYAGLSPNSCNTGFVCLESGTAAGAMALVFGTLGAAAGAAIGAALSGERWQILPGFGIAKGARLSIAPVKGRGAAASISVAF